MKDRLTRQGLQLAYLDAVQRMDPDLADEPDLADKFAEKLVEFTDTWFEAHDTSLETVREAEAGLNSWIDDHLLESHAQHDQGLNDPRAESANDWTTYFFLRELSSVHDAEHVLVQIFDEIEGAVPSLDWSKALRLHTELCRQQISRVEKVFQLLGEQPMAVENRPVRGWYQEMYEIRQLHAPPAVTFKYVANYVSILEQYWASTYASLIKSASRMGQQEVIQLLEQNLQVARRLEQNLSKEHQVAHQAE